MKEDEGTLPGLCEVETPPHLLAHSTSWRDLFPRAQLSLTVGFHLFETPRQNFKNHLSGYQFKDRPSKLAGAIQRGDL